MHDFDMQEDIMMWFLFWLPATLHLCEKKEALLMCHNWSRTFCKFCADGSEKSHPICSKRRG